MNRRRLGSRLLLALAVVALVSASLVPGGPGGDHALGPFGLVGADKWSHAMGYAGITLLALRSFEARREAVLVVALLVLDLGIALEIGQSFVPGRMTEFGDLLADAVGVVVGVGLDRLWTRR